MARVEGSQSQSGGSLDLGWALAVTLAVLLLVLAGVFAFSIRVAKGAEKARPAPRRRPRNDAARSPSTNVPSRAMYRTRPCRNHLTTGHCSYGVKCVFIHDSRVAGAPLPASAGIQKSTAGSTKDEAADFFTWPTTKDSVLDPETRQYQLNEPAADASHRRRAPKQMWRAFVSFCEGAPPVCAEARRLPVFQSLAPGADVTMEQQQPKSVVWSSEDEEEPEPTPGLEYSPEYDTRKLAEAWPQLPSPAKAPWADLDVVPQRRGSGSCAPAPMQMRVRV